MLDKYYISSECPKCNYVWDIDVTNIEDNTMYESKCPNCGLLLMKQYKKNEAKRVRSSESNPSYILGQQFIIVSRNIDGDIKSKICDDLIDACAIQLAFITRTEYFMIKETLKQEDINTVINNLNTYGRDRLANDEEEVYIFLLPARERIR